MTDSPAETVRRFDEAFNRHDLAAPGDLITDDDCLLEDTSPPHGRRAVGPGRGPAGLVR
jgi:hypothetical protein